MSVWLFTEEHKNLYDAADVYAFMKPLLQREKKLTKNGAYIWVLALNQDLVLLSLELMKVRSFENQYKDVKTADFFSIPLTVKATCIMIVHSHEDGGITPSSDDLHVTDKLMRAAKTVDLELLDHILINGKEYFSMAENNVSSFEEEF
jgi:DNA repair protein RadC